MSMESGEMSSDVTIGSLKIRVNIRRKNTQAPWPRWAVQLLDVDGSELTVDTLDVGDSGAEPKRATLTRNLSPSTESGDACSCPDCCDPNNYGYGSSSVETPLSKKRRISDGSDSTPVHHNSNSFSLNAHGQSPAWSDNLEEDAPALRDAGLYTSARGVEANGFVDMSLYGREAQVKADENARAVAYAQGQPAAVEPQRSQVRDYTDAERATLRAVQWPNKIKSNGLPTLWCHSCYLKKRLFKIVSPLSPKPSIVYFRHQQCNTSYHKGEGLPLRIVKLYQDYYRQRGAREQANAGDARNNNILTPNGGTDTLRAMHPAYINGRQQQAPFIPPQPAAQIVNGHNIDPKDSNNIDPADVPIEETTQNTKSSLGNHLISET